MTSSPDAIAVIVDCNCFLQLRDLKDLPWGELFPGVKRVEIMVTPSVVAELDNKKVDSKDRIRNRARAAFKLLDVASEAEPMRVVLRDEPSVVALNLPEILPTDWTRHPRLDPTRPDDALVAQAVDLATDLPKTLLSHDGGPRLTARRLGLAAKNVPGAWLLPDPVDDDRKQFQKLQRENEQLKARYPHIVAGWGSADKSLDRLTIERLIVPPLSGEAIIAAVTRCRAKWPHATGTMRVGSGFFIGDDDSSGRFDQNDYQRYFEKWQQWANGLPAFFESLPKRIAGATRFASVDLWFENTGGASAEGLLVDFATSEGWQVLADQKASEDISPYPVALPERPLTPFQQDHTDRAIKADDVSRQFRHLVTPTPPPRDPTGFYWVERPGYDSTRGVYRCEDFRSKRRNDDVIWLWPRGNPPVDGKLVVDIHSSSLGEPLLLELPLAFADRAAEWGDEAVVAALDPSLIEIVASVTAAEPVEE